VMDAELAATGEPLPPDWALQDPADYTVVLREAVPAALADAGIDHARVIGIGTVPPRVRGAGLPERGGWLRAGRTTR